VELVRPITLANHSEAITCGLFCLVGPRPQLPQNSANRMVLTCHNLAFNRVHSQLDKGQKREKRKFLNYFLLNIKVCLVHDLIYICQQNALLEGRVTLIHLCLR
jgi:hypothetical protein